MWYTTPHPPNKQGYYRDSKYIFCPRIVVTCYGWPGKLLEY
jgi:hypothetical protein